MSALFVAMITWHGQGPAQASAVATSSFPVMIPGPLEPTPVFPQSYAIPPLPILNPNLHVDVLVKSIHLIEQLQQDPLNLPVS